jgi:hypothetical protein
VPKSPETENERCACLTYPKRLPGSGWFCQWMSRKVTIVVLVVTVSNHLAPDLPVRGGAMTALAGRNAVSGVLR